MTHPPATCELCGGTGLYSPSALPCPKGCKGQDILGKLRNVSAVHFYNGLGSGSFASDVVEYITNMQQYISELEQLEKDARSKALDEAAKVADDQADKWQKIERLTVYEENYAASTAADASRDIATAIRALKDEVR